jgi:hypothetical protein
MGPQGPAGPAGTQGPSGVSGYEVVTGPTRTINAGPGTLGTAFANCPAGKVAIGGAFVTASTTLRVLTSLPNAAGWMVTVVNDGPAAATLQVQVICASTA